MKPNSSSSNAKTRKIHKNLQQMRGTSKSKPKGEGLRDIDIRRAAIPRIDHGIVIEEMKLGECRADFVHIYVDGNNFYMTAVEIKSDRDSLDRLANQSVQYSRFADFCDLLSNKLAREALDILPDHWGVEYAKDLGGRKCRLHPFREPKRTETGPWVEFELLWRRELLDITIDYKVSGFNSSWKEDIQEVIKTKIFKNRPDAFRQEALRRIYNRKDWRRRNEATLHKHPLRLSYVLNGC